MSPARERSLALALCAVGAVLILVSASQKWAEAVVVEEGFPRIVVEATGRSLAGGAAGIGLVALAGTLALLATRRTGRVITGLVLTAGGVFAAAQAVSVARDFSGAIAPSLATALGRSGVDPTSLQTSAWPWVTVLGGVALACGGLLAVLRGNRWPEFSRRYEATGADAKDAPRRRPVEVRPEDESDAFWKAQDRGEDPTEARESGDDGSSGSSRS